jgi:hypothetical protein
MKKDRCEFCGVIAPGQVSETDIVPRDICRQAGIDNPEAVRLCGQCRLDLGKWYSSKVSDTLFDPTLKRFRSRTPAEMVKEYESACQWFFRIREQEREKAR